MPEVLESIMLISFGCSWPLNVLKSYRSRTAKGKSLSFLCLILFGYAAGIAGKLLNPEFMAQLSGKWYVLFFYCLNFLMVSMDLVLYFRNRRLDARADAEMRAGR